MLRAIFLIAAGVAAQAAAAAEECYLVNGARGSVSFQVQQAGSPFRGAFRRFGGEVCLAQGRVTRIDVWLDPSSVDAGLPEIDAALKDREFFAVERYPRIVFRSDSVQPRGGDALLARGWLQIKGKRAALDVPLRMSREAGGLVVSGALTLARLEYGIGTGEWANTDWLGGEVRVEFRARLGRE
jgi:polyisoprenoid-binding protein YceI